MRAAALGLLSLLATATAAVAQGASPLLPMRPAALEGAVDDGRTLGRADASITIVEFSDYGCPFCRWHAATTRKEIRRELVDAGTVRYVFRDAPADRLHPRARKAAEAARCAADQGRFWDMNEALLAQRHLPGIDDLKLQATALGLDEDAFDRCLDGGTHARTVRDDKDAARADGVAATPTFLVVKIRDDGTATTVRIVGAQPIAAFRRAIERLQ